jgi:hypothetical protein
MTKPNKPGQPAAAAAAGPDPDNIADVVVDVTNGGFLSYRVEVEGGNPRFGFSCEHRDSILESQTFPGHPKAVYEWDLFRQPPQPGRPSVPADANLDTFVVNMLFVAARKYVVKIDHHKPGGAVVTVSSRTFESDDPEHIEQTATVVATL